MLNSTATSSTTHLFDINTMTAQLTSIIPYIPRFALLVHIRGELEELEFEGLERGRRCG
jgi:hypothetical protein